MKSPWPTKKIGEIREIIKLKKAPIGTVPYIEIGSIDVNNKKVIYGNKGAVSGSVFCPENSILISKVRPTRGAIVLINKKMAVSSAFTIIKPKSEIDHKLLFYFLAWNNEFFNYLGSKQRGTNYPSVRQSDILNFQISYPENKKEQQKIVYVLDAIQEAIWAQEKIIEKTKELKRAMMADLFKYGCPSFSKGRKLKKTEIGEIPEDWEVVRLGDILELLRNGLTYSQNKEGIGYPTTRIETISNGVIDTNKVGYIKNLSNEEIGKYKLKVGDILFSHINSIEHFSKTAIYLGKPPLFIHGMNLLLLRPLKEKIESMFLLYYLKWDKTRNKLRSWTKRAVNQVSLSQTELKRFKIPLPPFHEQREIVSILQTIDQKIEIEQKKKALYEELFKTMLNKLMSGEIKIDNFSFEEK